MGILDFLFYYLTGWFEKNKDKLKWSTPLERSCYGIALASASFVYAMNDIIHYTFFKYRSYSISTFLFVAIGLSLMQLYRFIYVDKGRFEKLNPGQFGWIRSVSEGKREALAIILFFVIFMSGFFVFMFFIPFGGHIDHPR